MDQGRIIIQALVAADSKRVWDHYTLPEHIIHWNFASDDWHCPAASNDLKVGGKFNTRMEAKDGSFGFDFEGTYESMNPGQGFTYVLPDDRKVSVNFVTRGALTEVTVIFNPESENPLEMQRDGWQAILNNFKKYAEESESIQDS